MSSSTTKSTTISATWSSVPVLRHENQLAIKLAKGVQEKGYKLWIPHQTNQVFVIVDNDKIAQLEKDFFFYTWAPYDESSSVIRLVISWGSTEEDVDAILAAL